MPTEQELMSAFYRGQVEELKRQRNNAQDQAAELAGQVAMLRLSVPVVPPVVPVDPPGD